MPIGTKGKRKYTFTLNGVPINEASEDDIADFAAKYPKMVKTTHRVKYGVLAFRLENEEPLPDEIDIVEEAEDEEADNLDPPSTNVHSISAVA